MAEVGSPPKKKSRSSLDTSTNLEKETEEFKFTKQSKRTRFGAKKSAKVTKSVKKRRSSFVRGRKERKSLAPPTVTGDIPNLCLGIPKELPPIARLRRLLDASLELAITKLAEKSSIVKMDLTDFEVEGKGAFNHLRKLVSETEIIDEAWQPSAQLTLVPNPQNKQLEESAVTCNLITQRLQKEENKWDEFLQDNKKLEEKAKQELQESIDSSGNKEECPDFLSTSQHNLLSGKPSFKSLADQRENLKETTMLRVDQICQLVNGIQQYKTISEDYLNKQIRSFGAKSLDVINDMGTPRTLIRGHLTGQ